MEKVIKDGKVAVLISTGYGAGWSTWEYVIDREILIFHPKLVELVESGQHTVDTVPSALKEILGEENENQVYLGGVEYLEIVWVPQGIKFRIEEYDGKEYIITENDLDLIA